MKVSEIESERDIATRVEAYELEIERIVGGGDLGSETPDGVMISAFVTIVTMLSVGHHLNYMWGKVNSEDGYHYAHQDKDVWFGLEGLSGTILKGKLVRIISSVYLAEEAGFSLLSFSKTRSSDSIYDVVKTHGGIILMDKEAGGVYKRMPNLFHSAPTSLHSHLTFVSVPGAALSADDVIELEAQLGKLTTMLSSKGLVKDLATASTSTSSTSSTSSASAAAHASTAAPASASASAAAHTTAPASAASSDTSSSSPPSFPAPPQQLPDFPDSACATLKGYAGGKTSFL